MKQVTLMISEDEFAFAERMAEEDDFFHGPEDYLSVVLTSALLQDMDEHENGRPSIVSPEQDGPSRATPDKAARFDDLDDGLPF